MVRGREGVDLPSEGIELVGVGDLDELESLGLRGAPGEAKGLDVVQNPLAVTSRTLMGVSGCWFMSYQ